MDEINPNSQVMVENAEDQQPQKPNLGPDFRPDNGPYQTLVDYCQDLYDAFSKSAYRTAKMKEIEDSRKIYEQKPLVESKQIPWTDSSNIVLPLTTITVDNLEPRLVSGLVGRDPVVRFEMEGSQSKDDSTMLLEQWFNQELVNEVKIKAKASIGVHTLLLEGTWFTLPKYDRNKLMRRDFIYNQQGGIAFDPQTQKPATADIEDVLYEGGQVDSVPFSDVYCADNIGSVEEWDTADKGIIIRPTYAELMRDKQDPEMIGYLPDKVGPWLLSDTGEMKKKEDEKSPGDKVSGVEVTGKEVIECINWYISYPINRVEDAPESEQEDFTEERIVATIAKESGVLIRIGLLRDFNFTNECLLRRVRLFPENDRSFGTSMYGKLKSIQNGASDFYNMLMNISTLCMIPWFFYDESSGMTKDYELVPGKGIPVDNVKGIMVPDFFKMNPAGYMKLEEMLFDLWEKQGNISSPQIGQPDDKQKTATEIMSVIQEGNIKYDYQANTTKDEFIGIIQTLYDLYYQKMPPNKKFSYNGQEVPIPRQSMRQRVKFVLSGSTASANKMIERKESEDILQMSMGNPLMNPMQPLMDVLKAYGKTDMQKYINPQANQMLQALVANPELPKVVGNYLKTKTDMMNKAGVKPKKGRGAPVPKQVNVG